VPAAVDNRGERGRPDCSAGLLGHAGQLVAVAAGIVHLVFNVMLGVDRSLHVVANDARIVPNKTKVHATPNIDQP
jgi:hypothetical protein